MALLTHVAVSRESPERVRVTLNVPRMSVLLALVVAALAAAAVLHGIDRETAAAWFTGMGEALLFGALGLAIGEVTGATDAAATVAGRPEEGRRPAR